ncbi:MAG: hypothetical protein JOY71_13705, partial [Acetobacteraceae bacterium]|nr:hypothetical protein [Acetobacteraceae bacterium]
MQALVRTSTASLLSVVGGGMLLFGSVSADAATSEPLWAWGLGGYGELGVGTTSDSTVPVQTHIPSGVTFTQLSGGCVDVLALDTDGAAWAWGNDGASVLGTPPLSKETVPQRVEMPHGVTFTAVAGSCAASFALDSQGRAWSWGSDNGVGELGDGALVGTSSAPKPVHMPSGVTFAAIAAGCYYALALDSSGRVWAWGDGASAELGNGSTSASDVPVRVSLPSGVSITQIAGGCGNALALDSNGNAWDWGDGSQGDLGNGTTTMSAIPVRVQMPSGVRVKWV